jgi:hypothetical protein
VLPTTPPPPNTPIPPPPTRISEVPEPASVYLFVGAFLVSLWLITRLIRKNRDAAQETTEIES